MHVSDHDLYKKVLQKSIQGWQGFTRIDTRLTRFYKNRYKVDKVFLESIQGFTRIDTRLTRFYKNRYKVDKVLQEPIQVWQGFTRVDTRLTMFYKNRYKVDAVWNQVKWPLYSCLNNKKREYLEYYFITCIFQNIKLKLGFRISCSVRRKLF